MWPITENRQELYYPPTREEAAIEAQPLAGNPLMRGVSMMLPANERGADIPMTNGNGVFKVAEFRIKPLRPVGSQAPFSDDERPQIQTMLPEKA